MVDKSIIVLGEVYVVRYMKHRNTYPAKAFLDSAECPGGEAEVFFARAQYMASFGRLPSTAHGHWLHGPYRDLFEFKTKHTRIFAFEHLTNLYVVSGAPKRKARAQDDDYERALNLRRDFYDHLT